MIGPPRPRTSNNESNKPSEVRVTSRRALLSVSDKTGIAEFGRALTDRGWEVLSTGGTARALAAAGVPVTEVSVVTGHPEMMDGRVKTLHPAIHAGLLARRDRPDDMAEVARQGYAPIDLVAVNLYPFRETVAAPDVTVGKAMENVDIGGPTLIRAAAKNHQDVWVVVDPGDYGAVLEAIAREEVAGSEGDAGGLRRRLGAKVFREISSYDSAVADYLEGSAAESAPSPSAPPDFVRQPNKVDDAMPPRVDLALTRQSLPRYGENPGQDAGFYAPQGTPKGIAELEQIHGKGLSYNNLLDLDGALLSLAPFAFALDPAVCIVKHTTPCGLALRPTLAAAFERARATDPVSAFGSVIAVNRPIDRETAAGIGGMFVECVAAPDFTDDALTVLTAKKNIRLLRFAGSGAAHPAEPLHDARWMALGDPVRTAARWLARAAGHTGADGNAAAASFRSIYGGVLFQSLPDPPFYDPAAPGWKVVTARAPTEAERADLSFAWAAVAGVKSNAILLAKGLATVGIGAGQTSRVDSSRLAVQKAREHGFSAELDGCALASDAFFPFRDGVDAAAEAGAAAIIQPGGSIRDDEVIAAADEHRIAMVFTGRRLFRH
ncbi:MAG: bifunctional phosphoribosylaminoimidazolecarboxamide formyltransferase/IMP cyclohydrolase [Gemmatimonadota bacterium]|nr:bifunctional phosphoribosylaminoimidazolecarboxamide formyltransferase/IMP cyclohydrolase [Gemmatimonadota bacterium]